MIGNIENKEHKLENVSKEQIENNLDKQKKGKNKNKKKIKLRTMFEILAFFAGCLLIVFGLLGIFGYASLFIGTGAIFAYSSAASFLVNLNYRIYHNKKWENFQLRQKVSFCVKIYFVPAVLLVSGISLLGLGIAGILNFGFGLGLGLSLISLATLPLSQSVFVLTNKEKAHRINLLNVVVKWMNIVIILCTLFSIVSIPLRICSILSLAATLIIGIPTAGVAISMGLLRWYEKNEYKKFIDFHDSDPDYQRDTAGRTSVDNEYVYNGFYGSNRNTQRNSDFSNTQRDSDFSNTHRNSDITGSDMS